MVAPGIAPKKIDFLNACVAFVFSFKSNKGEVVEHWIAFADGFSYPPQEFYSSVEKELAASNFPKVELSRVSFCEGGWLSGQRTYLRMMRERLALDVCAAPFGDGYFFSCRTVYVKPLLRLWHLLVMFALIVVVGSALIWLLGFAFAAIAEVALFFALAATFRNAVALGLADLDTFLLKIPALGILYERCFREETYHRIDTRLLFVKKIPDIVRNLAESITAEKGVKLLQQYESAPVFGDLYKRAKPRKAEPEE